MGIIQKYNPLSGKFDLIHSEDSFDDITLVANYSALPAVATVTGKFYWASASQGTSWLPGNLGGTYYPKGMYYSNGVTWEFLDVPYQATQSEVNTGTNTDKFVTPATLRGNFGTAAGTVAAGDDSRFNKDKTIALTITPSSHTSNTTETVKYTVSIPANTFTTGDKIYQEILATAIGLAGVKTIKTYINTTADLAGTPVLISTYFTNNLLYSLLSSFFVDSASTMKSYKPGSSNSATYLGSSNASLGTFSIDWTVQQYLVLSVQLANATDLIQLEALIFKRERI